MRVVQMSAVSGADTEKTIARNPPQVRYTAGEKKKEILPGIENFLSGLNKDDYILAGIIIVLILEGCEDYILLCALGYLFIMGLKEETR